MNNVRKQIDVHSHASSPSHATGVDKLLKMNSKRVIAHWKDTLSAREVKRIKENVGEDSKYFLLRR